MQQYDRNTHTQKKRILFHSLRVPPSFSIFAPPGPSSIPARAQRKTYPRRDRLLEMRVRQHFGRINCEPSFGFFAFCCIVSDNAIVWILQCAQATERHTMALLVNSSPS